LELEENDTYLNKVVVTYASNAARLGALILRGDKTVLLTETHEPVVVRGDGSFVGTPKLNASFTAFYATAIGKHYETLKSWKVV
jgi:hypothetical protein